MSDPTPPAVSDAMRDAAALTREDIENRIACVIHPQPDMSGRQINRLHGEQRRQVQDLASDIATAIAEAEARGRRQGLEEAAKAAERVRDDLYPILNKTRYQDYEVRRYHKLSVGLAVEDIRSLATAPTETQKPELKE